MDSYFKNTYNNFLVPHKVVANPKFKNLPASAKWLYICLCKVANRIEFLEKDNWFWHSSEQLMELSGLKRRTLMNAKKLLRECEFIEVRRGYSIHSKKRKYDYYKLNGFTFKSKK
ncbi:MAG: helix-turn-helix domain-containing protein [Candidatus Thorarchaeota archaeon]|jgi:hypothetical protein